MSKKWAETGILRKKQATENFDDLLVFGYACKLFRDDERALYIDQGKHLIPWMGNDALKIDRYDGRGALSDLSSCEASRQSSSGWLGLTENERKLERMCDEERYYSLHNNEEEEMMYKEEEAKRKKANEFKYNYDVPTDGNVEQAPVVATCEEEDKIFVPPDGLNVPADMEIPQRVKENARIEKTALFVSQQGPQMEILIKAKQSDNPQFSFMNQNSPLHKYYRHLLNAIKSGQYNPQEGTTAEENEAENTVDPQANNADDDDHYLHPSLAMTFNAPTTQTVTTPPPPAPVLPYKPTADCAYTQLVTRIKGSAVVEKPPQQQQSAPLPPPPGVADCGAPVSTLLSQDQSEHYYKYYQTQYYQYYQHIAHQYATQGNCDVAVILQNPQIQEQIQQQAVHYAQVACTQFTQLKSPAAPSPLIGNVAELPPIVTAPPEQPPPTNNKVSLVVYSSDSDDNDAADATADDACTFAMPPKDVAVIIDKMATYVSKNGLSFEQGVKAKGDPRFDFLHDSHVYHKYYRHKVNEFNTKTHTNCDPPAKVDRTIKLEHADVIKPKEKKTVSAVSFSIKKSKDEAPKDIKSALQAEESDEENISSKRTSPPMVVTSVAEVLCPPKATVTASANTENVAITERAATKDRFEMIDLTQEVPAERIDTKQRLAKERIKDRLASAVREKTLQMERKKRASQFLKQQSERRSEDRRILRADDTTPTTSESDLEEGEIKQRERNNRRRKSSHKRSKTSRRRRSRSKSRSRSRSKSRHRRKSKKRRRSPRYRTSSSESD